MPVRCERVRPSGGERSCGQARGIGGRAKSAGGDDRQTQPSRVDGRGKAAAGVRMGDHRHGYRCRDSAAPGRRRGLRSRSPPLNAMEQGGHRGQSVAALAAGCFTLVRQRPITGLPQKQLCLVGRPGTMMRDQLTPTRNRRTEKNPRGSMDELWPGCSGKGPGILPSSLRSIVVSRLQAALQHCGLGVRRAVRRRQP